MPVPSLFDHASTSPQTHCQARPHRVLAWMFALTLQTFCNLSNPPHCLTGLVCTFWHGMAVKARACCGLGFSGFNLVFSCMTVGPWASGLKEPRALVQCWPVQPSRRCAPAEGRPSTRPPGSQPGSRARGKKRARFSPQMSPGPNFPVK